MEVSKKLKIAHVVVTSELAGAQQVSLDILSSIQDENIKKYIICGAINENSKDFISAFERINVKIISVPSLKREIGTSDIAAFKDLYKIFKHYNFDIVHTNSTKPAIVARISAKLAGAKNIIHTIHGIAFHNKTPLLARLFYWAAEYFSALFGNQNVSVNVFYKKYYPFINTPVIHNGVNFKKLQYNKNENKGYINFSFMARLDNQKNPIEFLSAVKSFLRNYSGVHKIKFTLGGDGPLMNKCLEYIEHNGLKDKIEVKGWVRDKSEFYSNVDVLCQPSDWEAFGLVFIEAAYFKIPSIAKNVEGVPEVIESNITGFTYDADHNDMCKLMLRYANNPDLIKKHGEAAKTNAHKKFDIEIMTTKYKKLYGII